VSTSHHEVFQLREPLLGRCARRWDHWAHKEECPQATYCCKWMGIRLGKPVVYRSFVCYQCAQLFSVRWSVPIKPAGSP
jgi:hypothetical protein